MKTTPQHDHIDLLVFAALRSGPLHGYAIIEYVKEQSKGVFSLPEGTIYPALYRLENAGMLKSRVTTVNGRSRREYQLTKRGNATFRDKRAEWDATASAINAVLGSQLALESISV